MFESKYNLHLFYIIQSPVVKREISSHLFCVVPLTHEWWSAFQISQHLFMTMHSRFESLFAYDEARALREGRWAHFSLTWSISLQFSDLRLFFFSSLHKCICGYKNNVNYVRYYWKVQNSLGTSCFAVFNDCFLFFTGKCYVLFYLRSDAAVLQ